MVDHERALEEARALFDKGQSDRCDKALNRLEQHLKKFLHPTAPTPKRNTKEDRIGI